MKGKYITRQIEMVCLTKKRSTRKNIFQQLEETIAERTKVIERWEKIFLAENVSDQKDIHAQLADTIVEFKRKKQELDRRLFAGQQPGSLALMEKKAA
jgi:hypothetical protein